MAAWGACIQQRVRGVRLWETIPTAAARHDAAAEVHVPLLPLSIRSKSEGWPSAQEIWAGGIGPSNCWDFEAGSHLWSMPDGRKSVYR